DVGAVHVGVGHDDDLVVAGVVDLEALAHAGADRRDDGPDLLVGEDLVDARLLDVQDLASQREDRLEAAVAALLGRAARRVALDQVELGEPGVADTAVGQFAGEQPAFEAAFLADQLPGLARRLARPRRAHSFRHGRAGPARTPV